MLFKILIIFSIIIILGILSRISFLAEFLLSAICFFVVALLFIIILTLITDIKIFYKSKPNRNKIKKDADNHHYSIINYQDIEVSYTWNLNGGGLILAYEFAHLVSRKIGKVEHAFEYCSGPGFIGFNLLANNLCNRLTLADINPKAIDAIKETIKNNHLQDRVAVYQSDCLDSIPDNERWDLVVGNPPMGFGFQ
ncbi:MAG: methyltransferase [Candidatus Omnitrophica bacterium]|nr:methyltransferase [Candidatus Omnitrophota bacterium]